MENPGEMLRRAVRNRRRTVSRAPAPAPQSDVTAAAPQQTRPAPPKASHANYSALMRSHDRVHTCHLSGQGREGGA